MDSSQTWIICVPWWTRLPRAWGKIFNFHSSCTAQRCASVSLSDQCSMLAGWCGKNHGTKHGKHLDRVDCWDACFTCNPPHWHCSTAADTRHLLSFILTAQIIFCKYIYELFFFLFVYFSYSSTGCLLPHVKCHWAGHWSKNHSWWSYLCDNSLVCVCVCVRVCVSVYMNK